MPYSELIKRFIPLGATFVIGMLVVGIFVPRSTEKSNENGLHIYIQPSAESEQLRQRVITLERENLRLRNNLSDLMESEGQLEVEPMPPPVPHTPRRSAHSNK